MVLETRLISVIFLSISLFMSTACSAHDGKLTDQVKLEEHTLILRNYKGACLLDIEIRGEFKSETLDMKPPCYFFRKNNKNIQSFSYKDVDVLSTIIVIGSPVSEEKREKWGVDEADLCGERRQGILFKKTGVIVSEKTLDGGVVCKYKGADEKDFWYFSH